MVTPAAATMATTMGVVRLPGRPPTQCLSAIGLCPPVQVFAGIDHRPCQINGLLKIKAATGAGAQEGRDVQIRIPTGTDIANDCIEPRQVESMAVYLGAHGAHGVQR